MVDDQLSTFVRIQLERGYTREQIADFLIKKGYNPRIVREAVYSSDKASKEHHGNKAALIIIPIVLVVIVGAALFVFFTGTECNNNMECDDNEPSTGSICLDPGSRTAKCINPLMFDIRGTENKIGIELGGSVLFRVEEKEHILLLKGIENNEASIILYSSPREYTIGLGEHIEVDSNNDGVEDLHIGLISIKDNTAEFEISTISQIGSIDINIYSAKDTYEMGEEFTAEYTIDYVGDSFRAVVLVTYSRVGVEREQYSMSRGTLSEENTYLAKRNLNAFRMDEREYHSGTDYFFEEGEYIFKVSVFECEQLESELNRDCNAMNSDDIVRSTPLVSNQKTILVRGGISPVECLSSDDCSACEGCRDGIQLCESGSAKCMDCFMDSQCIQGYKCKENTCIKWECDFDAQCNEDSNIQMGNCIDNKCVYTPIPDVLTEEDTAEQDTEVCEPIIVDCGRSDSVNECFMEAVDNCCPATIMTDIEIEIFGMTIYTETYRELKGMENDKCIFYERTDDISLDYSAEARQGMLDSGMTEEEIEAALIEQNQMARDEIIGEEGTCKYPVSDLKVRLNNERRGIFIMTSEDVAKYACTGSKYDQLQ
ncbi:MAG: hypothetical protein ACMXYL_04455 [Candidatus Woesearchaeota archaeon]